jgi:hypothetical protein
MQVAAKGDYIEGMLMLPLGTLMQHLLGRAEPAADPEPSDPPIDAEG